MKKFSKVVALSLVFTPIAAQADVPTYGSGNALCGSLTDDRFVSQDRIGQWILGFVSGTLQGMKAAMVRQYGSMNDSAVHDIGITNTLEAVRAECRLNPDEDVMTASASAIKLIIHP